MQTRICKNYANTLYTPFSTHRLKQCLTTFAQYCFHVCSGWDMHATNDPHAHLGVADPTGKVCWNLIASPSARSYVGHKRPYDNIPIGVSYDFTLSYLWSCHWYLCCTSDLDIIVNKYVNFQVFVDYKQNDSSEVLLCVVSVIKRWKASDRIRICGLKHLYIYTILSWFLEDTMYLIGWI